MNTIDIALILLAIAYAGTGFMQGFAVNLAGTLGLMFGGMLGIALVPHVFSNSQHAMGTALIALGIVVLLAAIGQVVGTMIGHDIRSSIRSRGARGFDAVGGAALGAVAVLLAGWALGYSVSASQIPYLSAETRSSQIMRSINDFMPSQATGLLRSFNRVVDANLFPQYLDPFEQETIASTRPPDSKTLASPGVVAARASVVKILGQGICGHGIEGSGFVFSGERVMTNAHVVAGVAHPSVVAGDSSFDAKVVYFDPKRDVAVLMVPGLSVAPLEWDTEASPGDSAAVLGYPGNGPFDARAARIRQELTLRSPDIYGNGRTLRSTYSIRGLVRSGNSGGPLVGRDGRVLGVIFAASVSDASTGYALTAKQVAGAAATGASNTATVYTGACA